MVMTGPGVRAGGRELVFDADVEQRDDGTWAASLRDDPGVSGTGRDRASAIDALVARMTSSMRLSLAFDGFDSGAARAGR